MSYGSLKVTAVNGVKVYNVSSGKSIPGWLDEKKKRSLRKDEGYLRRIELVQDFHFNTSASHITSTPDGQYLVASGTYPPQVKVYELSQLALKFERHLDHEIVTFEVLGEDYSKLAFLCMDRYVCFHARFGSYFKTRLPKQGRSMCYDPSTCDLLMGASSPDIYRINLEQGRFLAPWETRSPAVNVCTRSPVHGLVAAGGEDGAVECFDPRQRKSVGRISAGAVAAAEEGGFVGDGTPSEEVTAITFDDMDGFRMAVGTKGGKVLLYDLRSSEPVMVKDHMYGYPIKRIAFHDAHGTAGSCKVISADSKIVKIWSPDTGSNFASVEPEEGFICSMHVEKRSGLILLAMEAPRLQSYFIPSLGPAPRWCSFLENLTEELEEEKASAVYEDFKFVTRDELDRLALSHLIGTDLLRAYMHGFFLDARLYKKAVGLVDPFAYERYRDAKVQERLEKERATRITVKKRLPKVNKEVAAKFLDLETKQGGDKKTEKAKDVAQRMLHDPRFGSMFTNKDFEIDPESDEFKLLHSSGVSEQQKKLKASLIAEHFEAASDEEDGDEDEEGGGDDSPYEDADDSDESERGDRRRPKVAKEKTKKRSSGPRWVAGLLLMCGCGVSGCYWSSLLCLASVLLSRY
eukprot:jgi/Mesvir1/12313/Mv00509-RA.1